VLAPTLLAIALSAGAQNVAPAAQVPHTSGDASLDRIRERLSQTSWLRISPDRELPQPMFRIEIHEHPYYTERPFVWTFAGGGYPLTAPGIERMGGSGLPKSFGGGTDYPSHLHVAETRARHAPGEGRGAEGPRGVLRRAHLRHAPLIA
jgi:hypothetical protein